MTEYFNDFTYYIKYNNIPLDIGKIKIFLIGHDKKKKYNIESSYKLKLPLF